MNNDSFVKIEDKKMPICDFDYPDLDIVKNYMFVEKQRFGDKLEVEYDLKSEEFFIPILSIQPIVENAVRHGIRRKSEGGKITISTFSEKEYHCVIVSDDGINSRMYRSKSKSRKDCYTFNLSEAKICSSEEAYQISTMMTKRSRVGRTWYPLRIK